MAASLRSWILSNCKVLQKTTTTSILHIRSLSLSQIVMTENKDEEEAQAPPAEVKKVVTPSGKNSPRPPLDPEISIRYLNSEAFVKGYGDKPVWFHYRRNFKGHQPPPTRESCIRMGVISTASPCPICRDEYLVLNFKNIKLLEQFISPYTGEIYDSKLTGLCQKQHKKLIVEVMKAWDEGLLEIKLPFRHYDYEEYKS